MSRDSFNAFALFSVDVPTAYGGLDGVSRYSTSGLDQYGMFLQGFSCTTVPHFAGGYAITV